MCVMPLDIWLEIFRYLRPVDLLQISRSCKMCREMLLDPSATSAWRAAFNNLDHPPPPLPADMSFAQYAGLVYGRYCHECATPNAKIFLPKDDHRYAKDLTPMWRLTSGSRVLDYYLIDEFALMAEKIEDLKGSELALFFEARSQRVKERLARRGVILNLRRFAREEYPRWGSELSVFHINGLYGIPGVNVAQDLTDRTWSIIRRKVIHPLQKIRENRFKE
ncbi:hypothetical protein FPV67DRAFT_1451176 [Lyophyllum atratum]|nr:hypothetical protein FPV67DRAFT_1451176 [Lyophyllum atratum]